MNSEKSYYILLAILLFIILNYFPIVKEGFSTANCSAENTMLQKQKTAYNTYKKFNKKLQKSLNDIKAQKESCDSHINNSIKNLASAEAEAISAANNQLYITNRSSENVTKTGIGAQESLDLQKNSSEIINSGGDKSLSDLTEAIEFSKTSQKNFEDEENKILGTKRGNLGPLNLLLEKSDTFSDLPPPPKAEYFQNLEGDWRQKWGKILKDVNITDERLKPVDAPKHGQNNIRIPWVLNNDLEKNMNNTAGQSIAHSIIRASDNVMSKVKEKMRENNQ